MTDGNKFKLSKTEMLQKKKLFVSKHNILADFDDDEKPMKKRAQKKTPKRMNVLISDKMMNTKSMINNENNISKHNEVSPEPEQHMIEGVSTNNITEVTSLDLLTSSVGESFINVESEKTLDIYNGDNIAPTPIKSSLFGRL